MISGRRLATLGHNVSELVELISYFLAAFHDNSAVTILSMI